MPDLEGYNRLKNNIISLNSGAPLRTIMVSSSLRKEGSSTIASNLASTLAKNNAYRVALVDANLRHPSLHRFFGFEDGKGLPDVLLGRAELNKVIRRVGASNLLVVSGGRCENPVEVLESQNLKTIIMRLKEAFDYLIFDSPPVNAYPDAQILASRMDGVILVVHAGRTRWEVAQKAKEHLEMARANILGVVLNRRRYVIPGFLYKLL